MTTSLVANGFRPISKHLFVLSVLLNLLGWTSAQAQFYSVQKEHVVRQTSNSTPVDDPGYPGDDPGPYSLLIYGGKGVSTGPTGISYTMVPSLYEAGQYLYPSPGYASLASLNAAHPDGTYTLTNKSKRTLTGSVYPNIIKITKVNGATPVWNAQGQLVLNPTVVNTLTWTPFTATGGSYTFANGGGEDCSFFSDDDADVNVELEVNGSPTQSEVTSMTIPANAFKSGITYTGEFGYFLSCGPDASYGSNTYFEVLTQVPLKSQTITFPAIADQPMGATVTLGATASSGLAVSYTVKGPATLSGKTLTVTGVGAVTVTASQAGSSAYAAAKSVSVSFTATKIPQTIKFPTLTSQPYGTALAPGATSTSGLTVVYTVVSGPATVVSNKINFTGVGKVVIQGNQAGNSTIAAAPPVNVTVTVVKASQTISLPAVGNKVFGVAPITLKGTASSGLAVTYKVTGPATVSGSVLTITGAGTVNLSAYQTGSTLYAAAPVVTVAITVSKATQKITFPAVTNAKVGTAVTLSATASSGLPVTYTVGTTSATVSGNKVTFTKAGTFKLTASQAGNANYAAATAVSVSVVVQ